MGVLPCSSLDDQMRIKWKTLLVAAASLVAGAILYTVLFVELHQGHRHGEVSRRQRVGFEMDRLPLLEERVVDTHYQRHRRKADSKSRDSVNRHSLTKVRLEMAELATNLKFPKRQLTQDSVEYSQDVHDTIGRFHIKQPFHFPQPHYSKADTFLLKSRWVLQLQNFLSTVEGNQVSLVTANQEHRDVVLNWLISAYTVANPPLKNVLVLTLDEPLHNLLQSRGIATLHISPGMIIEPSAGITRAFSQVHIVRLTVVRLINHYGYDLVNYDSDAILLKSPQLYFEKHKHADMIGTFGKGPMGLFKEWGVTLNTGVLLFRSNQAIESYWEAMSRLKWPTTDDQGNVNLALDKLDIRWMNFKQTQNINTFEHEIYGVCKNKMIVMLMPFNVVCRHTCNAARREEYYIWHALAIKENRTVENKMSQARVGGAWFLSENWMTLSSQAEGLKGPEWLQHIADPAVINSRQN